MDTITVAEARRVEAVGRQVTLQGWVRTRRDSKGGFSFIELNDGSRMGNVQIIADGSLPHYATEAPKRAVGTRLTITGRVKQPPAKGQATEVQAQSVVVHGGADPATYP